MIIRQNFEKKMALSFGSVNFFSYLCVVIIKKVIMMLRIDVFHYPTKEFLGSRCIPYNVFENGEKIVSNANEINSQVNEVRELHKKNVDEVFFKTTIIN